MAAITIVVGAAGRARRYAGSSDVTVVWIPRVIRIAELFAPVAIITNPTSKQTMNVRMSDLHRKCLYFLQLTLQGNREGLMTAM